MRRAHGFTIIETTIVLAVFAALLAIAIPHAVSLLDRIEVRSAVSEIEMMFSVARHAAIARAAQVTLDIDVARRVVSVRQGSEVIRSRSVGAIHGVFLFTNRTSITYSSIGVGYGAANFSLIISRGGVVDTIVVSRLGRVRH
jgi:prepilin-type N-terminal cleavage/methylation domain-containing protein